MNDLYLKFGTMYALFPVIVFNGERLRNPTSGAILMEHLNHVIKILEFKVERNQGNEYSWKLFPKMIHDAYFF